MNDFVGNVKVENLNELEREWWTMKLYFSDGTYDVSHWLLQDQRANHWDDLMPLAESFMTQDEINRLDMQGILRTSCILLRPCYHFFTVIRNVGAECDSVTNLL